ncbi:MAG: hypothetical protein NT075_16125 [Chloroflexi bacterium]|nr:hypothetical protein [Chloroflexota bacterium]
MAETDNPLKRLIDSAIFDFASWLLDAEVQTVDAMNIELLAELVRVDQLFRVTLQDGRTTLLHIEFQGKSTHRPMKWRMLEYMTRIADVEQGLDLLSVVFYVGAGAGASDRGNYQVNSPDGSASIKWQYRVIHLWKMQAQDLLALQRPGLLPLVGQTQIDNPQAVLPRVVDQLTQIEDEELKRRLLNSLLALVEDKELSIMIEKLVEEEGLLMDTPYLQRVREKGREEGHQAALKETRRQDILNALVLRFDPAASVYREIEKNVISVNSDDSLARLFTAIIQAPTLADFQEILHQTIAPV